MVMVLAKLWSKKAFTAFSLAVPCCVPTAAMLAPTPWTETRQMAVVRLEIRLQNATRPQVATGFLVSGKDEETYVLTATHGLVTTALGEPSRECKPVDSGLKIFLANKEKTEISGLCAIHLGSDLSLIRLKRPDVALRSYPVLPLNAREIRVHEYLHFAGFPFGISFTDRRAEVSNLEGPGGMLVVESLSARGMSGGPYLEPGGTVVGVHHGSNDGEAGWGLVVSIRAMRELLEAFLPPLQTGPAPLLITESSGMNCSAAAVAKAFRRIPVEVRAGVFLGMCNSSDPEVIQLLKLLPYEPIIFAVPAAAIANSGGPINAIEDISGQSNATDSDPTPDAKSFVKASMETSTGRCLDAASLQIFSGTLYCGTERQLIASPNMGGTNRPTLLVIHSSATSTAKSAIDALTRRNSSVHVVIDRNGSFVQLVPFDRVAWHAGGGRWDGQDQLNAKSVGIELVNSGRLVRSTDGTFRTNSGIMVPETDVELIGGVPWHRYTTEQIAAALAIGKSLKSAYPISGVVGHCDINPGRKTDPGPTFPMPEVEALILDTARGRAPCPSN